MSQLTKVTARSVNKLNFYHTHAVGN